MAIADAPGGIATASAASIEVAVDTIHTTGERAPALNINATIAAHGQAGSTATAPSVTVSTTCTLSATGTDAHAINVNIVPDGTNATLIDGDITVDVGAGSALFGGSGDGRAIHITRGDAIVISNRGAISALSGVAVEATGATLSFSNHGSIAGDVRLDAEAAEFINHYGAAFHSHLGVHLGIDGTLANAGLISPGGPDTIATTTITGNIAQLVSGSLAFDIDWTGLSDRIIVTGAATLAGTIVVTPHSFPVTPASSPVLILSANAGITDDGITATDTATTDYTLTIADGRPKSAAANSGMASKPCSASMVLSVVAMAA